MIHLHLKYVGAFALLWNTVAEGGVLSVDTGLIQVMNQELENNFHSLGELDSHYAPYFMAYRAHDSSRVFWSASRGAMVDEFASDSRHLDVEVRVGSPELDNTHPVRDYLDDAPYASGYRNQRLSQDPGAASVRRACRVAADFAFRDARERLKKIRTNLEVRTAEEDSGTDFTPAPAIEELEVAPERIPRSGFLEHKRDTLLEISRLLGSSAHVLNSSVDFEAMGVIKYLVHTQGTSLAWKQTMGRIGVYAESKAEDGTLLWLSRSFFFRDSIGEVSLDSVRAAALSMRRLLDSLRNAPVMGTYEGPVLLMNRAAGVYIHEVFGHRVEGHRQRAVDEGQTFIQKLGHSITFKGISIYDDPSLSEVEGVPLNGWFPFDDEGVRAHRTDLVRRGVFSDFLLSRSVYGPGKVSNSHGRAELGSDPISRMANTVVEADSSIPPGEMRNRLLEMVRERSMEFGLMVDEVSGGYTYTTRSLPQSFKLQPLLITQVFADGRPDRLVRGVDLVGTPLSSLRQVVAAGDDVAVFNGYCGAESGWLPVSAVSPSLLLRSMEFEIQVKDPNRPPFLPPPGTVPLRPGEPR